MHRLSEKLVLTSAYTCPRLTNAPDQSRKTFLKKTPATPVASVRTLSKETLLTCIYDESARFSHCHSGQNDPASRRQGSPGADRALSTHMALSACSLPHVAVRTLKRKHSEELEPGSLSPQRLVSLLGGCDQDSVSSGCGKSQ